MSKQYINHVFPTSEVKFDFKQLKNLTANDKVQLINTPYGRKKQYSYDFTKTKGYQSIITLINKDLDESEDLQDFADYETSIFIKYVTVFGIGGKHEKIKLTYAVDDAHESININITIM